MTKYTNWEDTKLRGGKQQQSDPYEENKTFGVLSTIAY